MTPPTNSWSARNGSMPAFRMAGARSWLYTASKSTARPPRSRLTPNGITTKQSGGGDTGRAYSRAGRHDEKFVAAVGYGLGAGRAWDLQTAAVLRDRCLAEVS